MTCTGVPCGRFGGKLLTVQTPTWMHASGRSLSPSTTRMTTADWPCLFVLNVLVIFRGKGEFFGMRIWFFLRPVCGSTPTMPRLCELMLTTLNAGGPDCGVPFL